MQHRRRYRAAIRHRMLTATTRGAAGTRNPATNASPRRRVTRADDERHAQREFIAVEPDGFLIFDLHDDGFVRTDIGDGVGEYVGTLLLDQRRLVTRRRRHARRSGALARAL